MLYLQMSSERVEDYFPSSFAEEDLQWILK